MYNIATFIFIKYLYQRAKFAVKTQYQLNIIYHWRQDLQQLSNLSLETNWNFSSRIRRNKENSISVDFFLKWEHFSVCLFSANCLRDENIHAAWFFNTGCFTTHIDQYKTIFDLPEPLKLCSLCVHSRVWPEPAKWWDSDLKEKIDFFHFFCRLFEGEGQKFISLKSARSTATRVVE